MNSRKMIVLSLVLSIAGSIIGYIFANSVKFGLCICTAVACDPACVTTYARIGAPVLFGMSALTVVFVVLLFVPKSFGTWKKFAAWTVPILAVIFVLYPTPGSGDYFTPDPEAAFKWLSGAFLLVSLVIIGLAAGKGGK